MFVDRAQPTSKITVWVVWPCVHSTVGHWNRVLKLVGQLVAIRYGVREY